MNYIIFSLRILVGHTWQVFSWLLPRVLYQPSEVCRVIKKYHLYHINFFFFYCNITCMTTFAAFPGILNTHNFDGKKFTKFIIYCLGSGYFHVIRIYISMENRYSYHVCLISMFEWNDDFLFSSIQVALSSTAVCPLLLSYLEGDDSNLIQLTAPSHQQVFVCLLFGYREINQ